MPNNPFNFTKLTGYRRPDVIAASVIINLLSLALPLVILHSYDRIIPNQAYNSFNLLTIGLASIICLQGLVTVMRGYITSWCLGRFEHQAQCDTIKSLLESPTEEFNKLAPGDYLDRFSAIDSLRNFYAGTAMLAVFDLPFVLLFLGLIAWIGGKLVVIPLIMLAVIQFAGTQVAGNLKRLINERSELDGRRGSFLIEIFSGIHTIKGLAFETLMSRRYDRLQAGSAKAVHKTTTQATLAQDFGSLCTNTTLILIVAGGSLMVIQGEMTMGMLAACTLLAGRTVQPVLKALSSWAQYQSIEIARARHQSLISFPKEAGVLKRKAPELSGGFVLSGVKYKPTDSKNWLFDDLDIEVKPGENIAILGPSGSGKTSLLHIMGGLTTPNEGTVTYDTHDGEHIQIDQVNPSSLRSQIGYLPQRPVTFKGTILENITGFKNETHVETALELAEELGLSEVFGAMSEGIDTQIGSQSADMMPSGISQRITIIRSLVNNPPIVLFDEANAALDQNSNKLLYKFMSKLCASKDVTVIMATYRSNLIEMADRVLRIEERKLKSASTINEPAYIQKKQGVLSQQFDLSMLDTDQKEGSND